jgi:hypothetical protein
MFRRGQHAAAIYALNREPVAVAQESPAEGIASPGFALRTGFRSSCGLLQLRLKEQALLRVSKNRSWSTV